MSYYNDDNAMRLVDGDTSLNISLDKLGIEREAINNEIFRNEAIINRYKFLQELLQDKRFIDVIFNGFIKEKSEEIFNQLTLPRNHRTMSKEDCDNTLDAISMLKKYLGYDSINGDLYYEAVRAKEIVEDIRDL